MGKKIDLTGQVFGKLTVLKEGERKNGKLYWTCQCECGNIKDIYGYSLRKGDTISCEVLSDGIIKEVEIKIYN